jgi:hypothetical protein
VGLEGIACVDTQKAAKVGFGRAAKLAHNPKFFGWLNAVDAWRRVGVRPSGP